MSWLMLVLVAATGPTGPAEAWPMPRWEQADAGRGGPGPGQLEQARDYALTGGGSGSSSAAASWCWPGATRPALRSEIDDQVDRRHGAGPGASWTARSSSTDKARKHHPTSACRRRRTRDTGWLDEITILHLATQTAGFEKPGGYGQAAVPAGHAVALQRRRPELAGRVRHAGLPPRPRRR